MSKDKSTHMTVEVIDLLELLQPLWRNKLAIICITIVIAIVAGIISLFFLAPEYRSGLDIYVGCQKPIQQDMETILYLL